MVAVVAAPISATVVACWAASADPPLPLNMDSENGADRGTSQSFPEPLVCGVLLIFIILMGPCVSSAEVDATADACRRFAPTS